MSPVILHVEDDREVARVVRISLKREGATVVNAGTLEEGLGYIRNAQRLPDLILLDLCLPDSRGLATLVAVVHEAGGKPIVVFTGQGEDEGDIDTIRRGATEYLVKGTVNVRDLARLLIEISDAQAAPTQVVERSDSQVIQMVERIRDVMQG